ncbi:hypothetical protein EON62_04035, partial [archaeon]
DIVDGLVSSPFSVDPPTATPFGGMPLFDENGSFIASPAAPSDGGVPTLTGTRGGRDASPSLRPHLASRLQSAKLQWRALEPAAAARLAPVQLHAVRMLSMAMDMVDVTRRIKNPLTGQPIMMRFGLHTGDVIGGVVGTKTFRYDIWGPDVLAANQMESNGVPGGVVVSQTTRDALVSLENTEYAIPGLSFILRGDTEVRGRGGRLNYYVVQVEGVDLSDGAGMAETHG